MFRFMEHHQHYQSVVPNGRSFTANSGSKAAVLPKGRSSTTSTGNKVAVLKLKLNPWRYSSKEPRPTSGCCQMALQGALWLAKRLSLNFNFSFLNRISLLLNQVATQLSTRGWVDPVPDPILPEKFLGYSRESNPGPLGWQSDMLTTIPNYQG